MKVYIGADHRGFGFKQKIGKILEARGHNVVDLGTDNSVDTCDYPVVAYKVAKAVAKTKNSRGVLVCMSGIGQSIAANKVKGAYAALCYNAEAAALSRRHNNANILVMSAKFIKPAGVANVIKAWFGAKFEGGRHLRRFRQIQRIEKGKMK